jgi:hypothetical protein
MVRYDFQVIPDEEAHTKVLRHGVGLQGEGVELVGVNGELLLDGSKRLVVNEEEDLSIVVSINSLF